MTRIDPAALREALEYYWDNPQHGPRMSLIFAAARAYLDGEAWQPIETAPKDETEVLLSWKHGLGLAIGFWSPAVTAWLLSGGEKVVGADAYFTHWRPLPVPPEST